MSSWTGKEGAVTSEWSLLIYRGILLLPGLAGLFLLLSSRNLAKKAVGLLLFQASILLLWFSLSGVHGGFANPVPLAIADSIAIALCALAILLYLLLMAIHRQYGTFEEEVLQGKEER
jgi:multisubunit Na+/H+ antiporter MnhC subunit